VLFLAEWGDLSQLLTAGLSARYDDAVSVFVGAWLALATVAGLAVVLGRSLVQRVRLVTIRRVGAVICLTLALFSLYDVLRRLA
jgi:putative Ca2+/H+ antiporter (TMEM165/GDT1 family)